MSIKKIFKAGVLGSIFGATIGLLFAKKVSSKTRGELKEKLGKVKDDFLDIAKKAAHELKEMKDEVQDGAQDIKKAFAEDSEDEKGKK